MSENIRDYVNAAISMDSESQVISAELLPDGTLAIVRRFKSNMRYANGSPCPDKVIRQVYAASKETGRIEMVSQVDGTHKPAHLVPESFEFP